MNEQLDGIDPATYAPYADPRDYITSWTDKIWISRGLGHLRDHYAPEVKVHTAYGETYGFDHVMRNSIQRMSAFHNRGGGHDDVVWEQRGSDGFISSHRVLNNATHNGFWTYGPPTGKQWVNRGTAHCLVRGGKVVEEWVMRDEFAVLQDLGLDPFEIAGQLARSSPVLGQAMQAAARPASGRNGMTTNAAWSPRCWSACGTGASWTRCRDTAPTRSPSSRCGCAGRWASRTIRTS